MTDYSSVTSWATTLNGSISSGKISNGKSASIYEPIFAAEE